MRNNTNLILNRIKKAKNIEKDAELARFLGITSGLLANWKARNTYNLEILLEKCSDISLDWLLLGKGEMLRTDTPESIIEKSRQIQAEINNNSDYIRELMETQAKYLKLLEKENERLLRQIDELKQRK